MERHFVHDLEGLKQRLVWMGNLAERAVHQAVRSVLDADEHLAETVLSGENAINEMQSRSTMACSVCSLCRRRWQSICGFYSQGSTDADLELLPGWPSSAYNRFASTVLAQSQMRLQFELSHKECVC